MEEQLKAQRLAMQQKRLGEATRRTVLGSTLRNTEGRTFVHLQPGATTTNKAPVSHAFERVVQYVNNYS